MLQALLLWLKKTSIGYVILFNMNQVGPSNIVVKGVCHKDHILTTW